MHALKTAGFRTLFAVTFTVVGTFLIAVAIFGGVVSVIEPGGFNLYGTPATSVPKALGSLLKTLLVGLLLDAAISASGAGLWLLARKLLFRSPAR